MVFRSRKNRYSKPKSRTLRSVSKTLDIAKDFDNARKNITKNLLSDARSLLKKYPYRTIILGIILIATGALTAKNFEGVGNLWKEIKSKVSGKKEEDPVGNWFGSGEDANNSSTYGAKTEVYDLEQRSRQKKSRSRKLSQSEKVTSRLYNQTKRVIRMI